MRGFLGNVSHISAVWDCNWFPLYLWGWWGGLLSMIRTPIAWKIWGNITSASLTPLPLQGHRSVLSAPGQAGREEPGVSHLIFLMVYRRRGGRAVSQPGSSLAPKPCVGIREGPWKRWCCFAPRLGVECGLSKRLELAQSRWRASKGAEFNSLTSLGFELLTAVKHVLFLSLSLFERGNKKSSWFAANHHLPDDASVCFMTASSVLPASKTKK